MWWGAPMSNCGRSQELPVGRRAVRSKGTQQDGPHPFPVLRTTRGATQGCSTKLPTLNVDLHSLCRQGCGQEGRELGAHQLPIITG